MVFVFLTLLRELLLKLVNMLMPSEIIKKSLLERDSLSEIERDAFIHYYGHFVKSDQDYYGLNLDLVFHEIKQIVSEREIGRLLDVGSGCGTESIFFSQFVKQVKGIEIGTKRLRCANERLEKHFPEQKEKCHFERLSILDVDENFEGYNLIWMNQAFHHLEPRNLVAEKLARLSRKGTVLYIAESNGLNPLIQLMLLKQRGFKVISSYTDENGLSKPYGNERVLSASSLKILMEKHGFFHKRSTHFRVFPNQKKFSNLEAGTAKVSLPLFCYTHYNSWFEYNP